MDEGAERLRKNGDEAPFGEADWPSAGGGGAPGAVGNEGIDADEKLRAFLQGDGGVQRLLQRAVDVVPTADPGGRIEAWQGPGLRIRVNLP
jgi:hypothetical protein